jgi:23S rRNA pseudouridine1911/1915/1917 synthase
MKLIVRVEPTDDGHRAVDVLIRHTDMSRLLSKKIRLYGRLTCNGQPHRMIDPVRSGDLLVAEDQRDADSQAVLHDVPDIPIRYADDWLIVAAKPSGIVTHPSYLHESRSLTSLLADRPLHPVGRLDRDTSGAVLIALNGHAHHVLSSHPMRKTYLAVLHGRLPVPHGLIQAPIRRSQDSIMLREIHVDGSTARTLWRELRYFAKSNTSLVLFELLTGRTHQIRVHCQAAGCPLVGDGLYGRAAPQNASRSWDRMIGRQALHAAAIQFQHPVSRQQKRVTAPLPEDFRNLLRQLYQREHQAF